VFCRLGIMSQDNMSYNASFEFHYNPRDRNLTVLTLLFLENAKICLKS